jgi:hypothetical protein
VEKLEWKENCKEKWKQFDNDNVAFNFDKE